MHRDTQRRWRRRAGAGLFVALFLLGAPADADEPLRWTYEDRTVCLHYNAAVRLLNEGKPEPAQRRLEQGLKRDPSHGPSLVLLADAALRLTGPAAALRILDDLAERAPEQPSVWTSLARARFVDEDFGASADAAHRALTLDPDHPSALQQLALVRGRTGDDALLLTELGERRDPIRECLRVPALARLARFDEAEAALAGCRALGDSPLVRAAERALGQAVAVPSPVGLYSEAVQAFNEGRWGAAERLATRSLDSGTPPVLALLLRAETRFEQGDFGGARKDLATVLGDRRAWVRVLDDGALVGVLTEEQERELSARVRSAALLRVRLEIEAGDLGAARRALSEAEAGFGDGPPLRAAKIELHQASGESGQAWPVLEAALRAGDAGASLERAAQALLFEGAALASDGAVALVEERGSPGMAMNLALGSANASRFDRCSSLARSLLQGEQHDPALALAYSCAVAGGELATADELGGSAGFGAPLEPAAVRAHIRARLDAGDAPGAEALIAGARALDWEGVEGERALELAVSAALILGAIDRALALVARPRASAIARAQVGTALLTAGRKQEALPLLEGACPELRGPAAEACAHNAALARAR